MKQISFNTNQNLYFDFKVEITDCNTCFVNLSLTDQFEMSNSTIVENHQEIDINDNELNIIGGDLGGVTKQRNIGLVQFLKPDSTQSVGYQSFIYTANQDVESKGSEAKSILNVLQDSQFE